MASPNTDISPREEYDPAAARATAEAYDAEAKATGWLAPEVAFGLVYEYLLPGQSILDLGIGSGLAAVLFRKAGLAVHGVDISPEMLAACRWKGFAELTQHDLSQTPYPFPSASFDHVACVGVLNFFSDVSPIFAEVARLLKPGGMFVFVVLERTPADDLELVVGPEYTRTGSSVTIHLYHRGQIGACLKESGLELVRNLPFPMYLDSDREESLPIRCYVARKNGNPASGGPSAGTPPVPSAR